MNCVICGIRKPRRHCPGVNGDICSICCGTERENSVDCPLECQYLQDAHKHERLSNVDPSELPNAEVRISEEFLGRYEALILLIGSSIVDGAWNAPGATDYDIREAIESLVLHYRGQSSGLIVDAQSVNPFAVSITEAVKKRVSDVLARLADVSGGAEIDEAVVLKALVFLQRLEYANNNKRKRSRAFLDFLARIHVPAPGLNDAPAESLEPEAPRVIL